jgi:hypothetical protein
MLSKTSRTKGASAEREVAALLGYTRMARNGLKDGDILTSGDCRYSFEVKRRARAFGTIYAAVEQALGYEPTKVPVALVRDDRRGWLVVMRLEDIRWYIKARPSGSSEFATVPGDPDASADACDYVRDEANDMSKAQREALEEKR